jgi:hypothetical protein
LIFANGGGQADSVYANDGAGAFSLVATLAATFSHDVAAADVDGDGNFDLVFAAAMGNPVYMGDGAGGFTQREMLGTRNSHAVAIADLNGNGRPDLAFANEASPSSIWINSAGTSFATPTDLTTGDAADVAAADLDGNGSPDLVFARLRGTATDVPANPIYANDGNGVFTLLTALGAAASTGVQVGDVDGDGIVDLVFVNANGVHQIWRGSGGAYTLYREQIVAQGGACGVLADLGNDGGLDLALGGATVTGSDVFLNDGFGNLGKGDAVPPVLTLLGDELVDVPSGGNYTDGGATAEDNIDGDISASIVATNMVNTAVVGTYTVTYNVTDIAGNPATPITRTVNVTPAVGTGGGGGGALDPAQLLLLLLASIAAYRARRAIIRSGA